jgi:hypothetical protein
MKKFGKKGFCLAIFLLLWILPISGMAQQQEEPAPADKKPKAAYYDFDDILIPSEISLDKKNSFVYGTTSSKVGVLIFEGRVEPASLANFFQNNMQKDGWTLLNNFKYREYLLNFLKENRVCVITITEKSFTTVIEIRVGPIEQPPPKGTQPR